MNTDLVGPPGLEMELEEGEMGEPLEHAIPGHRPFASASWPDRHLHPVPRVTADRSVHDAFGGADTPMDDRAIAACHRPGSQLGHEIVVGRLRLGDYQETRRVLVEAMHDSGAPWPADPDDGRHMGEDRRGERAVRTPGAGRPDHAGRPVD